MPLGDSITGNPGCWRALLWKKLQENSIKNTDFVGTWKGQGCGFEYDGENEGHGGLLVTEIARENMLEGWLRETKPDIIMMHLGTNDVWSDKKPHDIIGAYDKLVDTMRESKGTMKILVAEIIPLNPSNCPECGQRVDNLNKAIREWAPKRSNEKSSIVAVDCHKDFDVKAMTRDGVHPNDKGNEMLAEAWYDPLVKVIRG
ncbi:cellulose-binding family ii [Colletotrichum plurivorum]|uniref:Cellulose-binding family ii n=1 Tax=Colletotrichum plurivorum TaxID=2175906 RepID=A0A8H6JJC8_9PEZI|nr:cellulose-binding family ii [Colletotrichum plurivorum]